MVGGGTDEKNHPVRLVLCTKRKNIGTQSGPRLQKAFNYGQEPNIRELHARGGGSQKGTNDDEGEGGGSDTPQNWWRHLWTAP